MKCGHVKISVKKIQTASYQDGGIVILIVSCGIGVCGFKLKAYGLLELIMCYCVC